MIKNFSKKFFLTFTFLGSIFLFSCGDDDSKTIDPVNAPPPPVEESVNKITIDLSTEHQEMIGFGGALTWYSDRVVTSGKSEEIYQLMFEDLGLDILRLKNWYYPLDYPQNKSPETMLTAGDKNMFDATNTFYAKAKEYNQNVKILLSSWGPPPALKSNDNTREGTLKKNEEGYMYGSFAEYWNDILNNLAFHPDYISIQNEPDYINSGWTTCKWGATETTLLPSYSVAFDNVYEKIKTREKVPIMIGPESGNIQAFNSFAEGLKDKNSCPIYAYHPYNFNNSTDIAQVTPLLKDLHETFGNKPNIMTEYSTMSWFKTARFIQQTMVHANTSGYIYWELVWGDANSKDQAMIYIDGSGNYTVNPFFYVIKHFSKFIDFGDRRIEVTSNVPELEISGYMNANQDKITLVVINPETVAVDYEIEIGTKEIKSLKGNRSIEGDYFKDLGDISTEDLIEIPGSSITTFVIEI